VDFNPLFGPLMPCSEDMQTNKPETDQENVHTVWKSWKTVTESWEISEAKAAERKTHRGKRN